MKKLVKWRTNKIVAATRDITLATADVSEASLFGCGIKLNSTLNSLTAVHILQVNNQAVGA